MITNTRAEKGGRSVQLPPFQDGVPADRRFVAPALVKAGTP